MRLGVAEHILGQELRGAELRVFQRLHAAGDAALAGLAQEAARRAARELEHLAALLERVQREADGHVRAPVQELREDLHLDPREVREAVHIDLSGAGEAALRQAAQELGEAVRGVLPAGACGGAEGAHDEGEVRELFAERSARAGRRLQEFRLVEPCCGELVHGGEQLGLQLR